MRIDPFDALEPGDGRHVGRPGGRGSGDWLATRIRRGLAPLLLVGHPGLGKSTELRRACAALHGVAVLLDLAELRHGDDPNRVLYDIAVETVQWWVQDGPETQPSPFLVQDLRASDPHFPQGQGRSLSPADIAVAAWEELTGAAGVERLPLLLDGLDRLEPATARRVLDALLVLQERADLVVVAAPALTTGPANVQVLDRFRVVALDPLDPDRDEERDFLNAVARAHLEAASGDEPIGLDQAALNTLVESSGGVLRDLLGLAGDAWAYADERVDAAAVAEAIRDRTERFRRLLLAGDREALREADGTSGLEVPGDRKTRLLQHGVLLERGAGASARVRLHPLVRDLLDVP